MKSFFIILGFVFVGCTSVLGQSTIVNENIDLTAFESLPPGWQSTYNGNFGFRCDSTNSSAGYSGATGLNNIMIRNSDVSGSYTLFSPILNSLGLDNISIIWGSRVSNNFFSTGSQLPTLSFSTDGNSWTSINYADNENNSLWSLVNSGIPISLPSSANNAGFLRFKWDINVLNGTNGTYRMDDIKISGLTPFMQTVTFNVNMSQQPVNPAGIFLQHSLNNMANSNMASVGNDVFSTTITANIGDTIYFRYINGPVANLAEIVPSSCGTFYQNALTRIHIVGSTGNFLDTVCFGECLDCVPIFVPIYGCLDANACNFNSLANTDDFTCLFSGQSCDDGNSITENDIINADCWCSGSLAAGQCSDLFISEYVEGLGNNKAIEIYNPTNDVIDLSNYGLVRYSNGNSTAGDISFLTGASIEGHDTYVVVIDKRDPSGTGLEAPIFPDLEVLADTFINPLSSGGSWPMYFSGNDAIALVKDGGLTQVDLFGKIGEGSGFGGWNAYGTSIIGATLYISENHTLVKKYNVLNGVPINPLTFDVLLEYDSLPNNTFSNLGFHDCQCNIVPIPGCTSPNACNFNPEANLNDGTCLFTNAPCNDSDNTTINDIVQADCSCAGTLYILGCTDPMACNFVSNANIEDGSCLIEGASCNDGNNNTIEDIVNFNCDCLGEIIIEGCTNSLACNYSTLANVDDGTCLIIGLACTDNNPNTIDDIVLSDCNCLGAEVTTCPGMILQANVENPICGNDTTGSILINASSPYSPLNFLWSNGSTNLDLLAASPGEYGLNITDSTGCISSYNFSIMPANAEPIIITLENIVHNECFNYQDGSIAISVTGGSNLYYLQWNTFPIYTTAEIQDLSAGEYTLNVTDTESCSTSASFNILEPNGEIPVITGLEEVNNFESTNYSCNQTGEYYWTVNGGVIISGQGTSNIQVQWGTNTIGQIYLSVTDSVGCSVLGQQQVIVGTVGIFDFDLTFSLYPNPANNIIQFSEKIPTAHISFYDLNGRKIYEQTGSQDILCANWASGIYIMELSTDRHFIRRNVSIMH
jgi:hypothetical protein